MSSVVAFLAAHWGVIAVMGSMSLTAAFVTMPEQRPHTMDDFYRWFYDAMHQFANLRNGQRPMLPAATPEKQQPQQ